MGSERPSRSQKAFVPLNQRQASFVSRSSAQELAILSVACNCSVSRVLLWGIHLPRTTTFLLFFGACAMLSGCALSNIKCLNDDAAENDPDCERPVDNSAYSDIFQQGATAAVTLKGVAVSSVGAPELVAVTGSYDPISKAFVVSDPNHTLTDSDSFAGSFILTDGASTLHLDRAGTNFITYTQSYPGSSARQAMGIVGVPTPEADLPKGGARPIRAV